MCKRAPIKNCDCMHICMRNQSLNAQTSLSLNLFLHILFQAFGYLGVILMLLLMLLLLLFLLWNIFESCSCYWGFCNAYGKNRDNIAPKFMYVAHSRQCNFTYFHSHSMHSLWKHSSWRKWHHHTSHSFYFWIVWKKKNAFSVASKTKNKIIKKSLSICKYHYELLIKSKFVRDIYARIFN